MIIKNWLLRLHGAGLIIATLPMVILSLSSRTLYAASTYNVGYHIRTINYTLPNGYTKPITYAIWYPTNAPTTLNNYNRALIAPPGLAATDAPIAGPSSYPLIVFSHGAGACGTLYVYLNSYLASHGYIVAAPDHEDAGKFCQIEPNEAGINQGSNCPSGESGHNGTCDRPYDVNEIISDMLQENSDTNSLFFNSINTSIIGVGGHSAGGLTAMQVSGVEPTFTTNQVQSALMLAGDPGTYPSTSYANIKIPNMYQIGQLDTASLDNTPRDVPFVNSQAPKYLLEIAKAEHLAFDDTRCAKYATMEDCQLKDTVIQVILSYALSLFDYYLRQDAPALNLLIDDTPNPPNPSLNCYSYQLPGQSLVGAPCPLQPPPAPPTGLQIR